MNTTSTIIAHRVDNRELITDGKKIWPESMRGYPTALIQARFFSAEWSNKNDEITSNSVKISSETPEGQEIITISRHYSECISHFNGPLRMRSFRVLLELLNESKRTGFNDVVEISPVKLLKAAGIKPSGSAYSDIEQELIELTTAQFEMISNSGSLELSSLISFIDTGKVSVDSCGGEITRKDFSGRRFSKWRFCIGRVLEGLLNFTPLARINPNIVKSIGRSPLKLWLYSFYATHGGDGHLIFDYSIKRLLDVSGISESIEWRKSLKGLSESESDQRRTQNQYLSKALREQIYRLRKAVSWLFRLRIFRTFDISHPQNESLPVSSPGILIRASRFVSEFEEQLWSMPIKSRIRSLRQTS